MPSHEDTGTALGLRALSPQSLDLAVRVDLVVLEDGHLDLLPLVLDLLGAVTQLLKGESTCRKDVSKTCWEGHDTTALKARGRHGSRLEEDKALT